MLADVPMSREDTAVLTREALEDAGLTVLDLPALTDIDHFPDAVAVAGAVPAGTAAPAGRGVGAGRAGPDMTSAPGPAARRPAARAARGAAPRPVPRRARSPARCTPSGGPPAPGLWLGLAFAVCFVTGLISHWIQHPPGWFSWPASPAWLYRVTQGLHVATGLAAIPLLLVKLWTVYPKLFEWPPAGSVSRAVSRLSILVLVGASAMQLLTGLINIAEWYPCGFFFTTTHYWTGWLAIGAVAVHVGAKAPEIRRGLARRGTAGAAAGPDRRAGGRARGGRRGGGDQRPCRGGRSCSPPGSASGR